MMRCHSEKHMISLFPQNVCGKVSMDRSLKLTIGEDALMYYHGSSILF